MLRSCNLVFTYQEAKDLYAALKSHRSVLLARDYGSDYKFRIEGLIDRLNSTLSYMERGTDTLGAAAGHEAAPGMIKPGRTK